MLWLLLAAGSALFAGATAILSKCGVKDIPSNLATALRTIVVALFAWLMVFLTGAQGGLATLSARSLTFLILSGLATGASWLCYFKALQKGDVNKVAPIDRSSTVLTMLLAALLLGEALTWARAGCMALMLLGAVLMALKKSSPVEKEKAKGGGWLLWAVLSALFAALTSILAKLGIENVDSNLATAIRTMVVLALSWGIVFARKEHTHLPKIDRRSALFLALSGVATGASWLCYYKALQLGQAMLVAPIDKLSILITVAFSSLFLKEQLTKRAALGLVLLTAGTLLLLFV